MIYAGIIILIFIVELLIKNYVDRYPRQDRGILHNKIVLTKCRNKGACYSLFDKYPRVIAIVSLILSVGVFVLFIVTLGTKGNVLLKTGLAFLLGGAFSNTYDRLKRKYVVDYFSFRTRWKKFNHVVFNIGDFCILAGAMMTVFAKR